jgi:hypothetical protein
MNNKKHLRTHPQVRQRARELRQLLTPAEERLWQTLRSRQIQGYKFRRQHKAVFEGLATVIEKIVRICHRLEGAGQAKNLDIEAR